MGEWSLVSTWEQQARAGREAQAWTTATPFPKAPNNFINTANMSPTTSRQWMSHPPSYSWI